MELFLQLLHVAILTRVINMLCRVVSDADLQTLREIEKKLIWLSAYTVHHANNLREKTDSLKVMPAASRAIIGSRCVALGRDGPGCMGWAACMPQHCVPLVGLRLVELASYGAACMPQVGGHQASSTSLVTIMTALYFKGLAPHDRVAVKPHASPVMHAIFYMMGKERVERLQVCAAHRCAQAVLCKGALTYGCALRTRTSGASAGRRATRRSRRMRRPTLTTRPGRWASAPP
jgi:hypothetical protein